MGLADADDADICYQAGGYDANNGLGFVGGDVMAFGAAEGNGVVEVEINRLTGTLDDKFKAAHTIHAFGRILNDFFGR